MLITKYGADPNIKDNHGHTPLVRASQDCRLEIVQVLLDNGANPHITGGYGRSPLSHAEGWLKPYVPDFRTRKEIEDLVALLQSVTSESGMEREAKRQKRMKIVEVSE